MDDVNDVGDLTAFRVDGLVALVTGAGSGIGEATAHVLARAGAHVHVTDIDGAAARSVADRIIEEGGSASPGHLDVGDPAACEDLVDDVHATHGRCDVLVNNAGIGHVGTILETELDDLRRLWTVNVEGMYTLSRSVLPGMVDRGSGSIVNIASALGLTAMEDRFAYVVSKHAVVGLTRSLALDFGPTGVRINCICPGRVETSFVRDRLAEYPDPEKYRRVMVSSHPVGRMARPEEIANAVLYLAGPASTFVTGSTFVIDGGYLCGK